VLACGFFLKINYRLSSLEFGYPAFCAWGDILMDNFVLFICGSIISTIAGMGVLVYMVHVGYKNKD
jgi:hypothetical protein